jgi:tyrosine-protein phosphatase non-receptor type 4
MESLFFFQIGPKPDTCEDFWRMIWELKIKSIVMLTNTIEGALRMVNDQFLFSNIRSFFFLQTKCHQYWPELHQTITYGCYQITCIDKENFCDYEKRIFQLNQVS